MPMPGTERSADDDFRRLLRGAQPDHLCRYVHCLQAAAQMTALAPRHAVFVAVYLQHGNATRAAIAAGYSAASAYSQGSRLLGRSDIAAAIEADRARLMAKLNVTPER